jgi:hypothetical protein
MLQWNDMMLFRAAALLALLSTAAAGQFRAGAGRREITPREPLPMWGYGDRKDALSEGVLDPLYADAVVIEADGRRIAVVGLDLGRSPGEESLARLRARLKQDSAIEYAFLAGSHTHHAPVLELTAKEGRGLGKFDAALRYYRDLEEAIAAAVAEAVSHLAPARVAAGSIQLEGMNRNRHTKLEPKPVDRTLGVLKLETPAGKPLAFIVNYAAHPTSIPSQVLKYSADYPGALKNLIRRETGAAAVFMQGACGDLSTNRGAMDHTAYGEALGREALKLAAKLEAKAVEKPTLAVREERFTFNSRLDFKNPFVRTLLEQSFFPELVRNFFDDYAEGVRPRLSAVVLNREIAMVGASGEFFSSHAIRLRERSRLGNLFFFGYNNGYHQYFCTIEAGAEGGYGAEPATSPAELGAGERMMDAALIWLYQMLGRLR